MKNDEVIKHILDLYEVHTELTANEIHELIPENIAMIQIHKAIKTLKECNMLKEVLSQDLKYFSLIKQKTKDKINKSSRDTSKYTFNGKEYGKSRLALAIITFYVKKHNPTFNQLAEVFPIKLIPPYGLIAKKADALEASKDRARFFIKDHEIIELPDGPICVSNQFTKDRIEKFIGIAQDDLGYEIK